MQDANVRNWNREARVSVQMLQSLRELNHRFLDLVAAPPRDWSPYADVGLSFELCNEVAPLSSAQKAAIANCPYALFDLRFNDDGHWNARLRDAANWHVADASAVDENRLHFVRLALFFAWHVASTGPLAARLLLGMNEVTATAFRSVTIDCLPSLSATENANLTARWNTCASYWSALARAAGRPNPACLRRIQLHGLQLAAAVQLDRS